MCTCKPDLKDSKTVLVAYNTNDPDGGMSNTKDVSKDQDIFCAPVYMVPFL